MNKLILDTSTYYLYVSIICDGKKHFSEVLYGKNTHSENLMNVITKGLEGMEAKELDEIIVGNGPGSYTGVRVCMTVGKTMAWTLNIPLKLVSSLSLISSGYFDTDGIYAVSSIAKKDHVYGKIVRIEKGNIEILLDDIFLREEEFVLRYNEYENVNIVKEGNYKFNDSIIDKLSVVQKNIHSAVPNYLRKAQS